MDSQTVPAPIDTSVTADAQPPVPIEPLQKHGEADGPATASAAAAIGGAAAGPSQVPDPAVEARGCPRCGVENDPAASRCWKCNIWRRGNRGALRHGLYSLAARREALNAQFDDWQDTVLLDFGGPEAMSAVQLGLVRRLADAEAVARLARNALAVRRIDTPEGSRIAGILLNAGDRYMRGAALLGIERKPLPAQTLEAWLAGDDPDGGTDV